MDLSYSHVPLLTPFLIAFLSEKYKNAELEVDARGNQEIDINDVLMAMQEYRRLSVCLSMINGTRTQLPMDPTRLGLYMRVLILIMKDMKIATMIRMIWIVMVRMMMLRGEEWGYINDDNDVCQISWKLHFALSIYVLNMFI